MVRVVYTPPPPRHVEEPGMIPLTHHEILTLVGPFAERGRHVDLAASDRANRRLAFQPIEHAAAGDQTPALREVLWLDNPAPGVIRLERALTEPGGLTATLEIQGTDPGLLLAEIDRVPLARQFAIRAGVVIARHYRIVPCPAATPEGEPFWQVQLTGAEAIVQGVRLTANAKTGRGMPADLELREISERTLNIPQDLLAVLGWDWRPLRNFGKAWRGSVRIPKEEPERSRVAEIRINRTVEHLVSALGGSPVEFHARWRAARWRVTFQRAIPLLVGLLLLAVTPLVQFLELSTGSLLRMLIFHAPPLLMILLFTMREMPVIEVPPLPRPLHSAQWVSG